MGGSLKNLDLLSVGIAVAAMCMMSFAVYFNNRKVLINRIFLAMSLTGVCWSVFNYFSYQFQFEYIVLWLIRLAVFFAVWFSFFIFYLFYVISEESFKLKKSYKYFFVPLAIITSVLNLTPFVFIRVTEFIDGRVSKVENGPGIILFGIAVFSMVGTAICLLYKKMISAVGIDKARLKTILFGISITSISLIIFRRYSFNSPTLSPYLLCISSISEVN